MARPIEFSFLLFANVITCELKSGISFRNYDPHEFLANGALVSATIGALREAGQSEKVELLFNDFNPVQSAEGPSLTALDEDTQGEYEEGEVPMKKKKIPIRITLHFDSWFQKLAPLIKFDITLRIHKLQKYGIFGLKAEEYEDLSHGLIVMKFPSGHRVYVGKMIAEDELCIFIFLGGIDKTIALDKKLIAKDMMVGVHDKGH